MAKWKGSEGEVSLDSDVVGELQSWSIEPSRPYLDGTAIGDDARTGDLDIPEWSGELTARFDYGDNAQSALLDMLVANNDPTPPTLSALLDGSGGTKELTGDILPTSAPITAERGSYVEVSFSFNGEGSLSVNWA